MTKFVFTDEEIANKIRAISPVAVDPFFECLEGGPSDSFCKDVETYLHRFTAFADWKVTKCIEHKDELADGSYFSWEIER